MNRTIARRRLLAGVALLSLAAGPLAAQTILAGTVRQDSTGRPLAGVEVLLVGSDRNTVTDAAGRYAMSGLPSGRRVAMFRSVGFLPVRMFVLLGQPDTVWANPMMIARTTELEPLVVTAKPAAPRGLGVEAFEERRKLGFGKFIDSTDLRRNEHLPLLSLLDRLQGIGFGRYPGELGAVVAVSRRRSGPMGEPCYMTVFLDGVQLYIGQAPGLGGVDTERRPPPDLKRFDVASLEAVEVYRGAGELPIEFGGTGSACGAIVLWTRRGK